MSDYKRSENLIDTIALCICTRHRPESIRSILSHLETLKIIPRVCVIVDSSDDSLTNDIVVDHSKLSRIEFRYLQSLPGLPHQRNIGIKYLVANQILKDHGIVSFLDDDVRVLSDYFEAVSQLFDGNPKAICIGGYVDGEKKVNSKSLARRLALLGSRSTGVILRSGFAIPPYPTSEVMETQWIPGGMQNIRFEVFKQELFSGRIRMYGEDVEFYSRICKYGKILCSNQLPVKHLEAVEEKDNLRTVQCYTDGFRWTMASNKRGGVKKYAVLLSTTWLTLADLSLWVVKSDSGHKQCLLGHIDFVSKLIRRAELQQYVDHIGSGPNL